MSKRKKLINNKKRHVYGWIPDRADHRDLTYSSSMGFLRRNILLPSETDLRALCSRVENQGSVGSCTANASTSAMELIYKMLGQPQPELSRMFLYYATRVWVAGAQPAEDNGAHIRDVMKALSKYGVCLETTWPYMASRLALAPSAIAKKQAQDHQILHYYRCPTLKHIRQCLAEGFPAIGGYCVPASMDSEFTQKTGIVKYPEPNEEFTGGHAVLFVGYDDKKRLLTFKNSWGTGWGDKGYGYLPYQYVENWLANDFWTIRKQEM